MKKEFKILIAILLFVFAVPIHTYPASINQIFKSVGKIFSKNPNTTIRGADISMKEIKKKLDEKRKKEIEIQKYLQQYGAKR